MEDDAPFHLVCPITRSIMIDPVIDPDGNSYERAAIVDWLGRERTSPVTRASLAPSQLKPNRALKEAIEEYKSNGGRAGVAALGSQAAVPERLRCKLTNELMTDPVTDKDGNSYERRAIHDFIAQKGVSPMNKAKRMKVSDLRDDAGLKSEIAQYRGKKIFHQRGDMAEPFKIFHQREDLTTRIRNILRDYPRGTLPLREFVQNADDAGASRFAVLLDLRECTLPVPSHEAQESLQAGYLSPLMKECDRSRESLFIFNDATFSDRDFESVTSLGNSKKQTDDTTVGKYGLGFNVAYHYSDVVMFVSRDQLVVFDPHQEHLPGHLPGLRADYTSRPFRDRFPQQIDGFVRAAAALDFPLSAEEAFDGTLFQLPLRTEEDAKCSKISTECIDSEELVAVLREFASSAGELMVFLKHIERIDIMIRRETSTEVTIEHLGKTLITNIDSALRHQRCLLEHLSVQATTYTLKIEQSVQDHRAEQQSWLVHSRLHASPTASELATALRERPFLGAALPLHSTLSHAQLCAAGRPYCFLPLPLRTGLPVHLNAFFALSSNRRALWSGDNETGGGDGVLRERWNALLLQDALPLAYGALLAALAARPEATTNPALVYRFWPPARPPDSAFAPVASGLVDAVLGPPALPLLFDHGVQRWVSAGGPAALLLETPHSRRGAGPALRAALRCAGCAMIDPPPHVREALAWRRAHTACEFVAHAQRDEVGGDGYGVGDGGPWGREEEGEEGLPLLTPATALGLLGGRELGRNEGSALLAFCWETGVPACELLQAGAGEDARHGGDGDGEGSSGEGRGGEEGCEAGKGDGVALATVVALVRSKCACVPVSGGGMRCVGRPRGENAPGGRAKRAAADADEELQEAALIFGCEEFSALVCSPLLGTVDLASAAEIDEFPNACLETAAAVLRTLCLSRQTNLRELLASDVAKQMAYFLPAHWQDGHVIILQNDNNTDESAFSSSSPSCHADGSSVPSHFKSKVHATLRKQAPHSRGTGRWEDKLRLLWDFLERECFQISNESLQLPIAKYRELASTDDAKEVLGLFEAWPIVPLECGAVVSCSEARKMGVVSCAEFGAEERELLQACHVHLTSLHNTLAQAVLVSARDDVCRSLAIAFESHAVLGALDRSVRLQLRAQLLRWKTESSHTSSSESAASDAAPHFGSMTFQVSNIRRFPIFKTLDGEMKPITKDLFSTPPPPTTRDLYAVSSTWEDLLVGVKSFGAKILSYADEEARAALAMANMPRPLDEFELLVRICDCQAFPLISPALWTEVLRAVGRIKPWKTVYQQRGGPRLMQQLTLQRVIHTGSGINTGHLASEVIDTSDSLLMACLRGTSFLGLPDMRDENKASYPLLPKEYTEPGILSSLRHLGLITIDSADGFLLAARAVAQKGDIDLAFQLVGVLTRLNKDGGTHLWPSSTYDRLATTPFVPCIVHTASDAWPAHGGLPEFISPALLRAGACQRRGKDAAPQRQGMTNQAGGKGAAAEEAAMVDEDSALEFAQEQLEEAAGFLAAADVAVAAAGPAWALHRCSDGVLYAGAWSAFTACPILPREFDQLPPATLRRLQVAHPPPPRKVARHLLNLAEAWRRTEERVLQTSGEEREKEEDEAAVVAARQAVVQLCAVVCVLKPVHVCGYLCGCACVCVCACVRACVHVINSEQNSESQRNQISMARLEFRAADTRETNLWVRGINAVTSQFGLGTTRPSRTESYRFAGYELQEEAELRREQEQEQARRQLQQEAVHMHDKVRVLKDELNRFYSIFAPECTSYAENLARNHAFKDNLVQLNHFLKQQYGYNLDDLNRLELEATAAPVVQSRSHSALEEMGYTHAQIATARQALGRMWGVPESHVHDDNAIMEWLIGCPAEPQATLGFVHS